MAISIILFKLEGRSSAATPTLGWRTACCWTRWILTAPPSSWAAKVYPLKEKAFPTVDRDDPYKLSEPSVRSWTSWKKLFLESEQLQRHVTFLYNNGSMYRKFNGNLLFHGCVAAGRGRQPQGGAAGRPHLSGQELHGLRRHDSAPGLLLGGAAAGVSGLYVVLMVRQQLAAVRPVVKTFERTFIEDKSTWSEPQNPYYRYQSSEPVCRMLLREFGLYSENAHIINGHTPIHVKEGENPPQRRTAG